MNTESQQDVTRLLARIREGDQSAKRDLLNVAYAELRGLAAHLFRDQPGHHTLQPTALVNEVCARLLRSGATVEEKGESGWNDRQHFFRAVARAMRNLLTDHARARNAAKRGGGLRVSLEESQEAGALPEVDLVILDETLTRLAALDHRLGDVFELRFLVGLSVEHTSEVLGVSARTVELDTRFIRAWLAKELAP